ncbi:MAG: DoxX family protein [Parachlamydiales bacterium]|nr:DoxX family protein [Parachlamydiales bacterium]
MNGIKKFIALIGRLFLSTLFILSAVNKIFDWQKTETGLINLFCDWQGYVSFFPGLSKLFSTLISFVPEILIIVTVIELIGAILMFFGIKEKFGAFLIVIFFIPATFMLHPFWFLQGSKRALEMVLFLKNAAILGGLFLFLVFGSKIKKEVTFTPISGPNDDMDEE